MPVRPVKDEAGQPLWVTVDIDGTPVVVQVWQVSIGVITLYLLDTNIPEN